MVLIEACARRYTLVSGAWEHTSMMWLLALQLAVGGAQHYETAKRDFAQRDFSGAVTEVDAALHENPYMVPALVLKARLATFAKRPDVARSCLITAITVDPASQEAQFYLGVLFYRENNFKLAISPLQKAQTLSPGNPLPVFYLAMTQEALGEEATALDLYQQAENLSSAKPPLSAEILIAHGRLLLSMGRAEDGIEKERRAIEIDPDSRDAHYELAKGLDHDGDFRNAASEAERALTLPEVDTSDAQIHFILAALYRKLNQPALAREHLEKFLAARQAAQK
jgi:tetratricopeptide (TPR) repeat protein